MNENRINQVIKRMNMEGIDVVFVSDPDAIFYFIGLEIDPGERMIVLKIEKKEITLYINALFPISPVAGLKIEVYLDSEDPIEKLNGGLKNGQIIGIDKNWPSHFLIRLLKMRPDIQIEIGSILVDRVRMIKDANEIDKMKKASNINDQVMNEMVTLIKSNQKLSEIEMQDYVLKFNAQKGVNKLSFAPLISYGKNCSEPHHSSDATFLRTNDCIIIDMGGIKNGYCSDMTRSFHLGIPSKEYINVYHLVLKANLSAISAVKPGVRFSDIDKAARQVIEKAGYGEYFTHRTGHSIGINVHEYPDVSQMNDMIVEEGMIFSIEPGIYIPGKLGVRIEDLVCVTASGCDVLNHFPKELQIIDQNK